MNEKLRTVTKIYIRNEVEFQLGTRCKAYLNALIFLCIYFLRRHILKLLTAVGTDAVNRTELEVPGEGLFTLYIIYGYLQEQNQTSDL